jgi:YHS domain-containing protein
MDVKPEKAAGTSEYAGHTYYFCCAACKQKFDRNPKAYVGTEPAKAAPPT